MSTVEAHGIVPGDEPDVHDEPHIDGSRITVLFVKERVEGHGLDPHTVADRHDLDVADVYAALAYYHTHPKVIRQVERRRSQAADEHAYLTHDPTDVRE